LSTSSQPKYDLSTSIDSRVAQVVSARGLKDAVHVFGASTASASDAAAALSVDVAQIGKSIAFRGDDLIYVVLLSGSLRVDKAKLRDVTKSKKMQSIDGEVLEKELGYSPGGVSPLYLPSVAKLLVDESIERCDLIYVSAGTTTSVIGLTSGERKEIFGTERFDLSVTVADSLEDN
jgi:prolyl-tRNA editing enzyme YbaK/EbsC (Cys-tRNA(Pro) deacylase)